MQLDFSKVKHPSRKIITRLVEHGFTAYWAGGCVRDLLLGRSPKDFDVACSASSDEVLRLFPEAHAFGKAFGVTQVMVEGEPVEVAAFRKESGYLDGRHPQHVEPTDPETDAMRRDFTINGLFADPLQGKVIDFVGGLADLSQGLLRAIGCASDRFHEDHLRLLRGIRFASVLGFSIEQDTFSAIQKDAHLVQRVSAERIQQELTRMLLESPKPGNALSLLAESGLLEVILPEAMPMIGQEQPKLFHPEGDVFEHTKIMLNLLERKNPVTTYAVLFHDIGKPETASWGTDKEGKPRLRFNGHAEAGAHIAEKVMQRLRCSNDHREAVVHCVRRHMDFINLPKMKRSTLRKFMGTPHFDDELELHRVDCLGSHGMLDNYDYALQQRDVFVQEPVLPDPLVTGKDLIELGYPPGPELGTLKSTIYDQQLTEPSWNKAQLLAWFSRLEP